MAWERAVATALIAVAGALVATAQLSPAAADPVDLKCHLMGNSIGAEIYLSVDANAGTVIQWTTGYTRDQVPVNSATVTADSIHWTSTDANGVITWTLDRVSGALSQVDPRYHSHGYNCAKAAPLL